MSDTKMLSNKRKANCKASKLDMRRAKTLIITRAEARSMIVEGASRLGDLGAYSILWVG